MRTADPKKTPGRPKFSWPPRGAGWAQPSPGGWHLPTPGRPKFSWPSRGAGWAQPSPGGDLERPAQAPPPGAGGRRGRGLGSAWVCALLLLGGCAGAPLPGPGADEAQLRQRFGSPTASHPLQDGGRRLEFAQGPHGRQTWMADLDAQGRLQALAQVLQPARFMAVREGWSEAELHRWLGTPGWRQREYLGRETWYWRYQNFDCLVGAVTLDAQRRVQGGAALMPDPACDVRD